MRQPTLSLAMITKNSSKHLENCLKSIADFVDEIVIVDNGSTDNTVAIAKKFGARVIEVNPQDNPEYFCFYNEKWWPNFTRLRRLSFEQTTKDWIIWLDSDDTVDRPDLLAEKIKVADYQGRSSIVLRYLYDLGPDGEIRKEHSKERIVKRGAFEWERDPDWAVHENLYPLNKDFVGEMSDDINIVHHRKKSEGNSSNERNYNILMWMLQKDKFKNDPRVYFLLGRELLSLNLLPQAMKSFAKYLQMDYAPHDALDASINMCEINEALADFDTSLGYALKAIQVRPDHPLGYIYAARYLNYQGKYAEALSFLDQAKIKSVSKLDTLVQQPYNQLVLLVSGYCDSYRGLKNYQKVIDIIDENLETFVGDEKAEFEHIRREMNDELGVDKMISTITNLVDYKTKELKVKEIQPKIEHYEGIFNLFDKGAKMSPLYAKLRAFVGDFRVHDDNEITIVHMSNFEKWSPETIIQNGGGGSETACVELSMRWQKLGYKVTVYAEPPEDGMLFEGVTWRKFENLNMADHFNIFISLRGVGLFKDFDIKARQKYLWLQDIIMPKDYTPQVYDKIDKIIVLSKYHRNTGYHIPEEKFYYTTNGINLKLIEEVEQENIERVKNKCVYISSADRGLINMVKFWPAVKRAAPEAICEDYYGWNSWNVFGQDKGMEKYKQKLVKGMKKVGIYEGGRIGKKELYRKLFSADFHTYPLIGPAETSCIAVMESQACGAIPITTGITALEETQMFGIKVPLEDYEKTLIEAMTVEMKDKEKYRKKMMKEARKKFDWDVVAQNWINDLFKS